MLGRNYKKTEIVPKHTVYYMKKSILILAAAMVMSTFAQQAPTVNTNSLQQFTWPQFNVMALNAATPLATTSLGVGTGILGNELDVTSAGIRLGGSANGTRISAIYGALARLDFPSITTNTIATLTIAVNGVGTNAFGCVLNVPVPNTNITYRASVTATNVVTVYASLGVAAAAVDPAAADFGVLVFQP